MKNLTGMLARTAQSLEAFSHPRVSIAWEDTDLIFRRVYNPNPDLGAGIIGKRLDEVIDDKDNVHRLNEIKRQVMKTGKAYQETATVVFAGRPHHYDLTYEPTRNENGEIDGLISINIEITDLMEAKRQLAEANNRLVMLLDETLDTSPGRPRGKSALS